MSKNTESKDYIDWLNNSIAEQHIKYYDYSDFKNFQQLGSGAYGNVVRVNWKNSNRFFAIKSFNNDEQILGKVVEEVPYICNSFQKL
jgi:serine/threonine protein kinase